MLLKAVKHIGYRTATADTKIEALIAGIKGAKTRIMKAVYRAGGTAHTLTFMKPFGKTTVASAAATGQAVVNITENPGLGTVAGIIAANDYLVIRKKSTNKFYLVKVSSISTLAVTLTANVPVAFEAGDDVWQLGVPADVATNTDDGTLPLETTASAVNTYESTANGEGIFATNNEDEPIVFSSDNATAAGFLRQITYAYTDK